MGLVKSLKDMKELGADHGGIPSMREALTDVAAVSDDNGEREILKHGTPAMAVVTGFTSKFPGDRFSMQVPLEVHPASGEPYEVIYVFPVPRMQAPLMAGMEVPIKISPDDPKRIAVQWEAQKAAIAAAGGTMAAVQAALSEASGGRLGGSIPADGVLRMPELPDMIAVTAAAQSPEERLAKLEALNQAGRSGRRRRIRGETSADHRCDLKVVDQRTADGPPHRPGAARSGPGGVACPAPGVATGSLPGA